MTTTTTWGSIHGQEIIFPMEVDSFNSATLGFSVPAAAAAALLPGDAFEIVEVSPGTAQLIVSLVDYRQNPWGDYNEVNLGFLARPRALPTTSSAPSSTGCRSTRNSPAWPATR